MDDKGKSKIYRRHIIYLALSTRLAVVTLQFVSNIFIFDHKPGVFQSPKEPFNTTLFDKIINTFLGGFLRWDAQYFYHIAKYGYTYENTLAFFPLFPLTVRFITFPILQVFPFLDFDSIALIVFIVINIYCFTKAALVLYELSCIILNKKLGYRAAILFCLNPATIFFVAPYTESMFAYFTFTAMYKCADMYYRTSQTKGFEYFSNLVPISIFISLSIATRANGLVNIGFLVYFWLLFYKKTLWPHNVNSFINLLKSFLILVFNIFICLVPFILFQIFAYFNYCNNFENDLPKHLVKFAQENDLILPGLNSKFNQSWCLNKVPLVYSYVQQHYWNVGFLKYYELKQIPNFLLAAPIIYLVLTNTYSFFKQHKNLCFNLGIFDHPFIVSNKDNDDPKIFNSKMFVFVFHALYLTVFCLFFVHIQVTTRLLCSASPILYWYCSYIFDAVSSIEYDILPSWKCFLLTNELDAKQKFIKYYFFSYLIFGTILFSNYYPWT